MDTNLLAYIWRYTKTQQVLVIGLTLISFPILYLSLQIPKVIVNEALSGKYGERMLLGFEFDVVHFLVILCLALLTLIIVNGVLKMRINTLKGIIGERLIRRLRFQLIDQMLRFPLPHFSRVSQGELIATVTGEAEPLAGYISESVALPLFQGGTMFTILLFMFMQDWVFGIASVLLIPVQAYVIPKLQMQVNTLRRERVKRVRTVSARIGETVSGAREIRLQGTQQYTLAEFSHWFGSLFTIRLEIFKKKFFMKFLNNTIGQLTPFMFYLFGGLLVIRGEITIGALVASLAAYKDLTAPWKELLNHYQAHEDAKIKFQQIHEQFSPKGLLPVQPASELVQLDSLKHSIVLNNVSWKSETGEPVISGAFARFEPGSWTAIVSQDAMQRQRLAQLLVGLETPSSGSITLGGATFDKIEPGLLRGKLIYQGPDPHIFSGTIRENVFYGLNRIPPDEDPTDEKSQEWIQEAIDSGNSPFDYSKSWTDYALIDVEDEDSIRKTFLEGAAVIGADTIMYQRGLLEMFDPEDNPILADKILQARREISLRVDQNDLNDVVAIFDENSYNRNATVAENLFFGIPNNESLQIRNLSEHPDLIAGLSSLGVLEDLLEIGAKATFRINRRLSESKTGPEFLNQFDLEDEEQIRDLTMLAEQYLESESNLDDSEKCQLLNISLHLVPQRHNFGFIDELMAEKLLVARHELHRVLTEELSDEIIRFEKEKYHPKLTVLDNLLFGRVVANHPAHEKKITEIVHNVLIEKNIKEDIMLLLTESQTGIDGSRLPLNAKHRISVSRMIMKAPDVLVFHDALAPLDAVAKRKIRTNIKRMLPDSTLIWIDRSVDDPKEFNAVLRLGENGNLRDSQTLPVERDLGSAETEVIIGQSNILGTLDAEKQQLLAENSHHITVNAGEFVYRSGDAANNAYLIIKGEAQSLSIADEPSSIVGNPSAGEGFGLIEILVQRNRILSIKAVTDMELLRVSGQTLREIIDNDSLVVQTILRAMTDQWASGP